MSVAVLEKQISQPSLPLPVVLPAPLTLPTSTGCEENDGFDRTYYLQYQNKALLSEVFRLRHEVLELEQERMARRTQCDMARQCVDSIQGMWSLLELKVAGNAFIQHENDIASTRNTNLPLFPSANNEPCFTIGGAARGPGESSTGEGSNVESISSLLHSLSRLASSSSISPKVQDSLHLSSRSEENRDSCYISGRAPDGLILSSSVLPSPNRNEKTSTLAMNTQITLTGIQHRVSTLQSLILPLLDRIGQHLKENPTLLLNANNASSAGAVSARGNISIDLNAELQTKVSTLEERVNACHCQISEISASRDAALKKEKRVRRYLFRIMAGQPADEVLKDVELETDDIVDYESAAMQEAVMKEVASPPLRRLASSHRNDEGDNSSVAGTNSTLTFRGKDPLNASDKAHFLSSENADRYEQLITELESRLQAKQELVDELLGERSELQTRINFLSLSNKENKQTHIGGNEDQNADKQNVNHVTQQMLDELKRDKSKLEAEVEEWRNRVAIFKGQKEAIQKGMDEQYTNFVRRWKEMSGETEEGATEPVAVADKDSSSTALGNGALCDGMSDKVKIVTLEHKLHQALEGARRAEVFKQNLAETNNVVECLQKQVSEWSEKCQALQIENKTGATLVNGLSNEKVLKDNRKLKAKIEQLRSERDAINKTNHRLVQQSTEKEEINAEALSTILQLRQRIEIHSKEKEEWEKKFKAAQQLALAARLAATAKERVDEEASKEKETLEKTLADREKELIRLGEKSESVIDQINNTKQEAEAIRRDLQATRARCDELLSEANAAIKEKGKVMEDLKVTTKKIIELKKSFARGNIEAEDSLGGTQFTAKQLTTQLEVLKGRLTCPVCNNRDKTCILTRCRHMFCRSCVDTNIKNRSRKCPACGTRFDTKDVAEIWL